jgi:glucose-1-phosphate cytidylyltransferase
MMNLDFRVEIGSDSKSAIEYFGSHEEAGWTVTVLDTGELTLTGERILLAKEHIGTDPFFITYGDGIANVNLKELLAVHSRTGASLTISTAKPRSRFGVVAMSSQSDMVERFLEKPEGTELVNIGYMVASFSLFDYLEPGVALEDAPIARLAENGLLAACNHSGYWQAMDTIRELQILNKDWNHGSPAWATPL